jgi:hypothetical protein
LEKDSQPGQWDRSRTVTVLELQARLLSLLFPDTRGDLAQVVPLTSHGQVVMALLPWYHFQGPVRMDALRADLAITTEPVPSSEVRKHATALHGKLQQLATANLETLVALVILRHQEPVGALMLWEQYELLYPNVVSALLSPGPAVSTKISTLTIVQARNRLLRLPEDFAAGVLQIPLIVTKRVYQGKATEDRPVLLILPYPRLDRE